MNIIRVTKMAKNRIDAVFTGDKYIFLSPDFGIVAVAERQNNDMVNSSATHFHIERSEQIAKEMIESVIAENEKKLTIFNVVCTYFLNECNLPQHNLPYLADVILFYPNKNNKEA